MKVHDYTRNTWGHAIHSPRMVAETIQQPWWLRPFRKPIQTAYMTALIHGRGFALGDIVLVNMASGRIGRFIIRDLNWLRNPEDMWRIERADFDGYAPAIAIEAGTAKTAGLGPKGESAGLQGIAQKPCKEQSA